MSIYEEIKTINKQFAFEPKIENLGNLKKLSKFIIVGMGGSHLAGNIFQMIRPELDIIIHKNYGLPKLSKENLQERLIILSSYSGNTEEVLEGYKEAIGMGLNMAVISVKGKLLEMAKKDNIPYIEMLDIKIGGNSIEPRSALALSLKSFSKLIGDEDMENEIKKLAENFDTKNFEEQGKNLSEIIYKKIPIIYTSEENYPIAYIWKIKFNENSKIPAFCNTFPELNHNEMSGFDVHDSTKELSEKFHFIFLHNETDHPKIQKRMDITKKLYEDRGLKTHTIEIPSGNIYHKVFSILTVADFASHFLAQKYDLDSKRILMIEEFKDLIK